VVRIVGHRLLWAAIVLLGVAVLEYGLVRLLQPELDPTRGYLDGLVHDLDRSLLHLDFGKSCLIQGCPAIKPVIARGALVDIYMLAGSLLIGVTAGWAGALVIARRPRSRRARALSALATFFYCAPVYFVGYGLLMLFEHIFGAFPSPILFSPGSYSAPQDDFLGFLDAMVVPWLVLAAPVAGAGMRLGGRTMIDAEDAHLTRSGRGKGLPERLVVRRFQAPAAYPVLASYVGVSAPLYILNLAIVEWCFSVPGSFEWTKRALGQDDPRLWPNEPDVPWLQALGLWAAVLIILMIVVSDVLLALADPRVRATLRRPRPAG
jgi:peptide/nickel transport system permease protein